MPGIRVIEFSKRSLIRDKKGNRRNSAERSTEWSNREWLEPESTWAFGQVRDQMPGLMGNPWTGAEEYRLT